MSLDANFQPNPPSDSGLRIDISAAAREHYQKLVGQPTDFNRMFTTPDTQSSHLPMIEVVNQDHSDKHHTLPAPHTGHGHPVVHHWHGHRHHIHHPQTGEHHTHVPDQHRHSPGQHTRLPENHARLPENHKHLPEQRPRPSENHARSTEQHGQQMERPAPPHPAEHPRRFVAEHLQPSSAAAPRLDSAVPAGGAWTEQVLRTTVADLQGKSPQILEAGIDPRLGCARCVTQFGHRAYGLPITDSVANLESSMQSRNFQRVPLTAESMAHLQPGDIIVGHRTARPGQGPLHGHTAVYMGEGQVFNNNAIEKKMIAESVDIFTRPLYDGAGKLHMNGYSDVWIYRPRTAA